MKNYASKTSMALLLFVFTISCDKDDEGARCIQCDFEAVEICTDGNGMVSLVIEGETRETGQLQEGQSFEEAAREVCESIQIEEGCAECDGPNVEAFELCSTEDGITVAGQLIEDTAGLSLDEAIQILEDNPNNETQFEGLRCEKN